ncbi:MAG: DUF1800 domain-containing protein [Candidatus Rokubacteria bacterium]|nr:DUF1800 domain-containing protein [Candidatus Rokubacteria bacterium]MBI3825202.1 DUF1800 domain-containing protein [Candidatus Rokubacteria bacterium]
MRRFALVVGLIAVAVGAGRMARPDLVGAEVAAPAPATTEETRKILHLLSRATYGPRPGDVARVQAIGVRAWLEQQLDPRRLDDPVVAKEVATLTSLTLPIDAMLKEYPRPARDVREKVASGQMTRQQAMEAYPPQKRPYRIVAELQAAKAVRAVSSERQLEEVMVDFWFNHFNVNAPKGVVKWYLTAYERDAIRPHALGRFRDLVRATSRHPAMLFYLDNYLSVRPDFTMPFGPQRGKKMGLNENYARELMELHTLGVDGGYTQQDVTEVARAFTGWGIERPQADGRFVFRGQVHDRGEKLVLGQRIPAGGGQDDGERVMDILVRHPSTARFVAAKLVRRFVADDAPASLVDRVATTYLRTDGDVKAMLRTILTAEEFYANAAYRAKIKRPFEFVVSAVRALDGTVDARGGVALARAAGAIGEKLYECEPPTGYPDRAEAWVNPGALLARMNFGLALASRRLDGVRVDVGALVPPGDREQPAMVMDRLLARVLPGEPAAATRQVLLAQLDDPQIVRKTPDDRGPADTDVATLLALVIGSPDFQRR